ncbi:MAG TPA: M23 family metallopeptidase [Kofleriaceae bacterium]
MTRWLLLLLSACVPPPRVPIAYYVPPPAPAIDMARAGVVVERHAEFAFTGGRVELELRRDGDHLYEIARNHYAVAVVVAWQLGSLGELEPLSPTAGVVRLDPAAVPGGEGPPVVLAQLQLAAPDAPVRAPAVAVSARFGDPRARPRPYAYRLPYARGTTFAVLQGFHGAFSHRGSNEYAIDFDCPVATQVLAARPGVVVATFDGAQGSGTTPEFLAYGRANFVLVLHDDGTLGEYMHLAPSGVEVAPGQRVARGERLALSGNTGFSSTPHLHFAVMTAGEDGRTAQSFRFQLAIAPDRVEEPVQGRTYPSWE